MQTSSGCHHSRLQRSSQYGPLQRHAPGQTSKVFRVRPRSKHVIKPNPKLIQSRTTVPTDVRLVNIAKVNLACNTGVLQLVSGFTWATPSCNPGVPRGYPPTALSQSFSVPRTKTLLGPEVKCLQHLVKSVCHTAAAGRVYRTARMLRILHTPHRPDTLLFLFLPNFQATRQVQTKAIGGSFGDTNWCCATGETFPRMGQVAPTHECCSMPL